MVHKFEIFSAGCNLCKNTIETLKNLLCEECELVEYNLQDSITEEIQEKIKKYDIQVVPTLIVDEEHKFIGIPKSEEIKKILENK